MRLPFDAVLEAECQHGGQSTQKKRLVPTPEQTCEATYVSDDGSVGVSPMAASSQIEAIKLLMGRREQELQQAAEYGLGLLEANEELQMEAAALKIRLETETHEISVERDTWQRRTAHAQQESAQWERKFLRVKEEMAGLAEEFEQFIDRCQCRRGESKATSNDRRHLHQLDTIAQLEAELQELHAAERLNEAELAFLRQFKKQAEQQQQEALECEALVAQSEESYRKQVEAERRKMQQLLAKDKSEVKLWRKTAHLYEAEAKELRKQLILAEEARDDAEVRSNGLSELLLSSKSRCNRLERELELLEHVSYFTQASVDRDDEESDSDDESIKIKEFETDMEHNKPQVTSVHSTVTKCAAVATPSPLRMKRRRSFFAETQVSSSSIAVVAQDGSKAPVSESEMNTHKKLYHYFYLTAISIINENNLHDRCFSSSSRVTIEMWYREILARDVPFLLWHSWLINRISHVAASVHEDDNLQHPSPNSSFVGSALSDAFHAFLLRKNSHNESKQLSPKTSSPATSPAVRVPLTMARAFFRLLRKNTHAETGSLPDS